MKPIKLIVASVLLLVAEATPSKAISVEFLQAGMNEANIEWLFGIACRNYDHIVHLDISVEWPVKSLEVEKKRYQRLIFWNDTDEYLFPKGSFSDLHGSYIIKGYFIARSGGMHHGVTSSAFEKVDDAQVMLSPGLVENKVKRGSCDIEQK